MLSVDQLQRSETLQEEPHHISEKHSLKYYYYSHEHNRFVLETEVQHSGLVKIDYHRA